MDFYISWSHSDPIFSDYFNVCPILVSAVPENKHRFKRFKNPPSSLIVDSGAIFYSNNKRKAKLTDVLNTQISMIEHITSDTRVHLVHVDVPLFNRESLSDKYMALEKNLYNAFEYMNLFTRSNLPKNIKPLAVIQGYDIPSIRYTIFELKKMGYKKFGLGSLLNRRPIEQIAFIKSASELVGPENLHVFGVTGIPQLIQMSALNISSFDSTRPTMTAVYHQLFYSKPFRTYLISDSKVDKTMTRIKKPLECDCPVCIDSPYDIFNLSHRKYTKLRALHNYYHFLKTVEYITCGKEY